MNSQKSKDKTLKITKAGNLCLTLTRVQFEDLLLLLDKVHKYVAGCIYENRQLNLVTAEARAGLALLDTLYTNLPHLVIDNQWRLQFTLTEAYVFWTIVKRAEHEVNFSMPPGLIEPLNKLYQKLI